MKKIFFTSDVILYEFNKNEILPMHTHEKQSQQHITIIISGKIKAYGPNFETNILSKNDFYDFKENEQTHEILALEDNTTIINIPKYLNKYEDVLLDVTLTEYNKKLYENNQGINLNGNSNNQSRI